MSDHPEQAQETPIVVYAVQTVSLLTSVGYALQALGTLVGLAALSAPPLAIRIEAF